MGTIKVSDVPGFKQCKQWKLNARLSKDERETHINIDGEGTAHFYSSVPKHIRRFIKQGYKAVGIGVFSDAVAEAEFVAPAKAVSFRKISYPENAGAAGTEALRKYRESQAGGIK